MVSAYKFGRGSIKNSVHNIRELKPSRLTPGPVSQRGMDNSEVKERRDRDLKHCILKCIPWTLYRLCFTTGKVHEQIYLGNIAEFISKNSQRMLVY